MIPAIEVVACILRCFVCTLESTRFPSSDALSGLGPYRLVLHLNGSRISIPKYIIYIRFMSRLNLGVIILVSEPIHGWLRWKLAYVCYPHLSIEWSAFFVGWYACFHFLVAFFFRFILLLFLVVFSSFVVALVCIWQIHIADSRQRGSVWAVVSVLGNEQIVQWVVQMAPRKAITRSKRATIRPSAHARGSVHLCCLMMRRQSTEWMTTCMRRSAWSMKSKGRHDGASANSSRQWGTWLQS